MHPALTIGLVLQVAAVAAGAALFGVEDAPATVVLLAGVSAVPALGSVMSAWALVRTEGAAAIAAIGAFGFAAVGFALGGLALRCSRSRRRRSRCPPSPSSWPVVIDGTSGRPLAGEATQLARATLVRP